MDLSKLEPFKRGLPEGWKGDHLEFMAAAIGAFDVMMRRKWWAEWDAEIGWVACNKRGWMRRDSYGSWFVARDPFTPLLEADKWMKEQEDASRYH